MQTGRPRSIREAAVAAGDDLWDAIDEFMDEFYLAHPDKAAQQAMIDEAPELTGDAFVDAYFAAMGEHLAMRWELRTPAWTREDERMGGDGPSFVPDNDAIKPILLVESPYAFRTRNIFTGREPLQRARWPRDVEKVERLMAM